VQCHAMGALGAIAHNGMRLARQGWITYERPINECQRHYEPTIGTPGGTSQPMGIRACACMVNALYRVPVTVLSYSGMGLNVLTPGAVREISCST